MTHPGEKEGKIYIKEPEGTTFTLYPDGSGFLTSAGNNPHNPNKDPKLNSKNADESIAIINSIEQDAKKKPNELSYDDEIAIHVVANAYGLETNKNYVSPTKKIAPFLTVNKIGDDKILFKIRKLNKVYVAYSTEFAGGEKQISVSSDWQVFSNELAKAFSEVNTSHETEKPLLNKLSTQEDKALKDLGKKYSFNTIVTYMDMEPDAHNVMWVKFVDKSGKTQWVAGKDNGKYVVHKDENNTWDLYVQSDDFNDLFLKFEAYLKGNDPFGPNVIEHKGLTIPEYSQIRDVVNSFGTLFDIHYSDGNESQRPSAFIYAKEHYGFNGFRLNVGALGKYYHVLDANLKGNTQSAIYSTENFNDILEYVKDSLTKIGGPSKGVSSQEMADLMTLMQEYKFGNATPGGGANNNYIYVKDDDKVDISNNGYVTFTRRHVFGPIRHIPVQHFINWFKFVYTKGEIPSDSKEMMARIFDGMAAEGFIDKKTGGIRPSHKIAAIKWLRNYVETLTGSSLTLKKAKWAIENINTFLDYVGQHGLPPSLDEQTPDDSGLFVMKGSKTTTHKASAPQSSDNPLITKEQFDWLEASLQGLKPGLSLIYLPNGVVEAKDPSNVVNSIFNPVFYVTPNNNHDKPIRLIIYTSKGGMSANYEYFATFTELSDYIHNNLDYVLNQYKGPEPTAPDAADEPKEKESQLGDVLTKRGFEYKGEVTVMSNDSKWYHYENKSAEMVDIQASNGIVDTILKDPITGEFVKMQFQSIAEFVTYIQDDSKENTPMGSTGDGHLDELIDDAGFQYAQIEPSSGPSGTQEAIVFVTSSGYKLKYFPDDHSSLLYSNEQTGAKAFDNTQELKDYLQNAFIPNLHKSSAPTNKIPTGESDLGMPYKPDPNIQKFLKKKGFQDISIAGDVWEHPSKFYFELFDNGIKWHSEKSKKEIALPKAEHHLFLSKALALSNPQNTDDDLDNAMSWAAVKPEEHLMDEMVKMAEESNGEDFGDSTITKQLDEMGFQWYSEEKCWANEIIYQVITAHEAHPMAEEEFTFSVLYIKNGKIDKSSFDGDELLKMVGPHGILENLKKSKTLTSKASPTANQIYQPSGETYKTQDNDANAHLIWLNAQDENVLKLMGFFRVPQENRYYKNSLGDIISFRDTGKADFSEFAGKPHVQDTQEFTSIVHALNFIVMKYTASPFSSTNYTTIQDPDDIQEIQLDATDSQKLAKLGFEWNSNKKAYIKFLKDGDPPMIHPQFKTQPGDSSIELNEVKKKKKTPKKQKPKEKPTVLGGEYYEILTGYNTGNAIWQLVHEENSSSVEVEKYEGTIAQMLYFLWLRWRHTSNQSLDTAMAVNSLSSFTSLIDVSEKFASIKGMMMPQAIHLRFINLGFTVNDNGKDIDYTKEADLKFQIAPMIVKFDGTWYSLYYPYSDDGATLQHKMFESPSKKAVLNKIVSLQKADFGPAIQTEEEALKKKDNSYFNCPPEWKQYSPYAPKASPDFIKPSIWIQGELNGYGFKWSDSLHNFHRLDNSPTDWHQVQFYKNGTIVYFYPAPKSDYPRYFCTKEFNEIQLQIEKNLGGQQSDSSQPYFEPAKGNNGHILDANNYPKMPELKTFSFSYQPVISLVDQDHDLVKLAGFNLNKEIYQNGSTGDEFKVFNNGAIWYNLSGVGTGMTNEISHFFDMLKEKYGVLEWGTMATGDKELKENAERLAQLGFKQKAEIGHNPWIFHRISTSKKTTMTFTEEVSLLSGHRLHFALFDHVLGKHIGSCDFDNANTALNLLESQGPSAIALYLTIDMATALHQAGFSYDKQKHIYENNQNIHITFYGDGVAWVHVFKPVPGTADEFDIVKEHQFNNFFNAIQWAQTKDVDVLGVETTPVTKEEVDKVMKDLKLKWYGNAGKGEMYSSVSGYKHIEVNLHGGIVRYRFYYISNPVNNTLGIGETHFKWPEFIQFLEGKLEKKPLDGYLPYTPNPKNEKMAVMPQPMPFSSFDYHNWSKGKGIANDQTIGLMPEDDKTMLKVGFQQSQDQDGAICYKNSKGQKIYFYVNGEADFHIGDGKVEHSNSVKDLMSHLWIDSIHSNVQPQSNKSSSNGFNVVDEQLKSCGFELEPDDGEGNPIYVKQNDSVNYIDIVWDKKSDALEFTWIKTDKKGVKYTFETWKFKTSDALEILQIDNELNEMGFKSGEEKDTYKKYQAGTPNVYLVFWDKHGKTIQFALAQRNKVGNLEVKEQWTNNVQVAMQKLHDGFDAKPKAKSINVEHELKSMGFKKDNEINTGVDKLYEKAEPPNYYQVVWRPSENMIHFTWIQTNSEGVNMAMEDWTAPVLTALKLLQKWNKSDTDDTKVDEELKSIGFVYKGKAAEGSELYEMQDQAGNNYQIGWFKQSNLIVFKHRLIDESGKWHVIEEWTKPVEEAMGTLYKVMDHPTPKAMQKSSTGEVPYSGLDYKEYFNINYPGVLKNHSISITVADEITLKQLGFEREITNDADSSFKTGYYNPNGQVLYFFASGAASYWDNGEGPKYYNSVKELMQAMWDKYMPHI